jgi:hypothetical protein
LHGASNLRAVTDGWRVLSIIARESRALRNSAHVRSAALEQLLTEPLEYAGGVDRADEEGVAVAWPEPELALAARDEDLEADHENNVIQLDYAAAIDRQSGRFASATRR